MEMRIQPIDPHGQVDVAFTRELISPGELPRQAIYNGAFRISVESLDDGSKVQGRFGSSAAQRRLDALDVDSDLDASRL